MRIWRVPYPKFGDGPGLDRVTAVAARLGIDLGAFGVAGAVVVGSNGKGSTAAMTAAVLQQTGARVGLFTSPHLFDLNERFRIDGEDISDLELDLHWRRGVAAVEAAGLAQALGGFEFLFLIAADWFAARKCAHTVWEAGIGGRLDPVRLISARRVALTGLDLEHTALLGDTLEAIAKDKLDAAPFGANVFYGERTVALRDVIVEHCASRGVAAVYAPSDSAARAPLPGAYQQDNAALALALVRDLAAISEEDVARGLAATRWPGRLEVLSEAPLIVIDVGHTPDAIRRAREGFDALRGERDAILVCGASRDKDAAAVIAALAQGFSLIVCAAARHKGMPSAEIAAYAHAANANAEVVIAESVADARAIALARADNRAVYVAGGLFLAAEFRAIHYGRDPASLAFF